MKSQDQLQIFVQSPELRIPSRALTVNPNHTLRHLKLSFLPPTAPSQTLDSLYFSFDGKPLRDSSTLLDSRIPPLSSLLLRIRVSGGGGDGGATGAESRDCYLNMYAVKKPDKVDPNETRLSRWTTCALSFEPLKHPCVIDRLGNVFNKEPLVEALLGKKLPRAFGHIKGLKDMIPIQLSAIPGVKDDDIIVETRFQCPISGLEFNGKYKFFALRSCGHVLSAKALKEVKSSACLVCHQGFSEFDKIVINGTAEEVAALRERMEEEKAKLREKKEKKVKNGARRRRTTRKKAKNQFQEMEKEGLGLEITELRLGLPGGCPSMDKNEKKRAFSEIADDENSSSSDRKNPVKNQVVGWPPVCSYRKKSVQERERVETTKSYVKISMDGAPFLRKIDLKTHEGYSDLAIAFEKFFGCFGAGGIWGDSDRTEYIPIYEDKDGDWMLVGDVPWEMFTESCKRLRIMKKSDTKGFEWQTKPAIGQTGLN